MTTPYELKSVSLQTCTYQETSEKSLPVDLAAEYHRHLNASAKRLCKMHLPNEHYNKHVQKLITAFLAGFGWSAAESNSALDQMLGQNALSESQVYRIHKAMRDEDESIFVDHRKSGAIHERPISGDQANIDKVEEHITDNPHISIRALAAQTGLSRDVVGRILDGLGAVKKFAEFVPGTLDITQKQQRRRACQENLALLEKDSSLLERVIAEDECWLYAYQERIGNKRYQWCIGDQPPQPEPHQKLHEEKSMLVFFFDHKGPLIIDFIPQGQRINSLLLQAAQRPKQEVYIKATKPKASGRLPHS